jgi:hypothetical protein
MRSIEVLFLGLICMTSTCAGVFAENASNFDVVDKPIALSVNFSPPSNAEEKIKEILDRQWELDELHMDHVWLKDTNLMNFFFSGSFPNLKKFSFTNSFVENWMHTSSFAENLEELSMRGVLLQTGADFGGLMNLPSLRILDISSRTFPGDLRQISFESISLEYISLYGLEKLYLEGIKGIKTFPFKTFAPNLKHLSINESFVDSFGIDGFLSSIASLANLEALYLGDKYLCINNYILNAFKTLPVLKELSLRGQVREMGLDFSNFHALEKLDLSSVSNLSNYEISSLTGLHSLEILSINGGAGWNFNRLIQLDSLRILNIGNGNFTGWDFHDLAQLGSLRTLNITNGIFTTENKEQILYVSLPNIEELFCDYSNIHGAGLASFVPNLKRLTLRGSNITGGDLVQIAQLKNLESLDLGLTSISGASIKKLAKLLHLNELSLADTDMSKTNFSDLPQSLKTLDLSGSILTLASLSTLHCLTHLNKLDLQGIKNTNIAPALIQQLKKALPNCEILY